MLLKPVEMKVDFSEARGPYFSHWIQDLIQEREILKEYFPREHIQMPSLNWAYCFFSVSKKLDVLFVTKEQ